MREGEGEGAERGGRERGGPECAARQLEDGMESWCDDAADDANRRGRCEASIGCRLMRTPTDDETCVNTVYESGESPTWRVQPYTAVLYGCGAEGCRIAVGSGRRERSAGPCRMRSLAVRRGGGARDRSRHWGHCALAEPWSADGGAAAGERARRLRHACAAV